MRQVGGCGAPLADIGTCRTATIDRARTWPFPVRQFGEERYRGLHSRLRISAMTTQAFRR